MSSIYEISIADDQRTEPLSPPQLLRAARKRARRSVLGMVLGMVCAALTPMTAHATGAFLPSIVSSTTVPPNGDLNPYGVAVVPLGFPTDSPLGAGDILVSNFNNSANQQGTGSTIVTLRANGTIAPNGSATVFFQGGSGLGLNTGLGVLRAGFVIVGNLPTADGTFQTVQRGSLLVIDRNGNLASTIPADAATTLNGPWDLALFDQGNTALLWVANVLDGTVSRLNLSVGVNGVTVTGARQIASGYAHAPNDGALVVGPTGLAFDPFRNVLYVASTADNAIFAIDHATTIAGSAGPGRLVTQDPVLRGPLGLALAPNGDLIAANGDSTNADPAHPSEIVEFTPDGKLVTQFNVDSGQAGAFGVAVGSTPAGLNSLIAVDDVTNTLQVLPLAPCQFTPGRFNQPFGQASGCGFR